MTARWRNLIGALLTAGLAVACGANHPRSKLSSRPSGPRPETPKRSSRPTATPILTLPGLGSLSYRCGPNRLIEASLDTQAVTATEYATVEGNGRHLRDETLNPGRSQLTTPAARYHTLTWRVIQSTELETLEATVRLHLHWSENFFDCSLKNWTSTMKIIGHHHKWSVPDAWP
jgi:hypothetical protein